MRAFLLSDVQAEAILNMRLRSLRKLEEMEIRKEHKALTKERKELQTLLAGRDAALEPHRRRAGGDPEEIRRRPAGRPAHRLFAERRPVIDVTPEAFVEREPITVILSDKGWIRAVSGQTPTRAS